MVTATDSEIIGLISKAEANRTETTNIEFKDARGGIPSDLWKPVSSFSHKPKGGVIVFGVREERPSGKLEIVGGLDLAILQEKIVSLLNDGMRNVGAYDLRIFTYKGKSLLALLIDETPDEKKPCYLYNLSLPRGACVREGNTDRAITDEEMRTFIRNTSVFKFDRTIAIGTTVDKLSLEKVKDFLTKSAVKSRRIGVVDNNPTEEVMENLGIIDRFDNGVFPTVGGFLIFSKGNPQKAKAFSRYIVRCVRYRGDSVASPIVDKLDVDGTLDSHIELIQNFILRNIPLSAKIVGSKRVEQYEFPEDAIRELVANAVIHRDYMITETYTQVNIFSNRIEISNPGNLPPGVTVNNIKDSQFSRNEIIAQILKDMDYLEEYGRGIDIVFSRMSEWGLLEPIFKNMSNSFRVTLLGSKFKELNSRQIVIWNMLQDKKRITSRECRDMFPETSRATIGNDLSKLVTIGLAIPRGSTNNTYYEPHF
nr:hypothetical protein [Candidatus Levybacteria bacterium]